MVRSDEDGEEGGERKGEDAEHFDSAPWMSEQREEAGGSNRRMMETIVVEALRNLWGNINEELLVYEERLEEVAQQGEEKRRRETGSHRVRANEDDLYRRGQGARLVEGAVREMVPRGEEARMESWRRQLRGRGQRCRKRRRDRCGALRPYFRWGLLGGDVLWADRGWMQFGMRKCKSTW